MSDSAISDLKKLYSETHDFSDKAQGGMFYSVYSKDLSYREKIHKTISQILEPFIAEHFTDYRVMLCSFVVKVSGPDSEFYLHQDTTGLDEWVHSPVNIWIPLLDVNENSGCLGIVPGSHGLFSPYRSISFPSPFDAIQGTVKKYLRPLPMQEGEVLLFDNRLIHNSYKNESGHTRVAVVCGLFPKNAQLITCHKKEPRCGGKVEMIAHSDDFMFTYTNFLIDCQKRPHVGSSLGFLDDIYHEISAEEFEALCEVKEISQVNGYSPGETHCVLIEEPR